MKATQIVLASRPTGMPTTDNFRFEEIILPELAEDEILLKPLFFSVDPYMRGRMNKHKSYAPAYELNKPITGSAIAEVIESKIPNFKKGDKVVGMFPWATKILEKKTKKMVKIEIKDVPVTYYLGILGMPGLTAYLGLTRICNPQAGETVVVSGAAGAVGTIVGQIARIRDCRTVGITGSDEKADLLIHEFGYDKAINYKTSPNLKEAIANACPNGVDCYFDNVGGDITDAVIANINFNARIAICGQIALYNEVKLSTGIRLLPQILSHNALIQGFLVNSYSKYFTGALSQLHEWIMDKELKYHETIIDGFDKLPEAFLGLFKGDNIGKMIVKVE